MFQIGNRLVGSEQSIYFIAELSCNHRGQLSEAIELIRQAKEAGADAIKIQTYTGDTITLKSDQPYFKLQGTNWDSDEFPTLWHLFEHAHTPWLWTKELQAEAHRLGLDFFSSPFDHTAVDFLESLKVPAYKVASMEIIDIPLLKKIASTGKPVIVSTGMASLAEIEEAIRVLRKHQSGPIALLKCTSAYPAKPTDAHLRTLPHLASTFQTVVGLSDHTLGIEVPVASVCLGAQIIEKHFTLDRSKGGPDATFSLEPSEFKQMVTSCRIAQQSLGEIHYGGVKGEVRLFRRSLFVVKDMTAGEVFKENLNVRSIRPGDGLHTRHLEEIVGRKARVAIRAGTPLSWNLID